MTYIQSHDLFDLGHFEVFSVYVEKLTVVLDSNDQMCEESCLWTRSKKFQISLTFDAVLGYFKFFIFIEKYI